MRDSCGCSIPELDDEIQATIDVQTEWIEGQRGLTIVATGWEFEYSCWPRGPFFPLPHPPTRDVQKIEYYDQDGALQTLSTSNYRVALRPTSHHKRSWIQSTTESSDGYWWPAIQDRMDAIKITLTGGFDADAVPPLVKSALAKAVTHDYMVARDAVVQGQALNRVLRGLEDILHMIGPTRVSGVNY